MSPVKSLSSASVKQFYLKLGVDVDRFLSGVHRFDLIKGPFGLLKWFPQISADGLFYEQLSRHDWYYSKEKDEFGFVDPFVFGKTVLEIGCGVGFFADHSDFYSYVGLELNENAALTARSKGHHVECIPLSDYANMHPQSFDVVCSFQVLEHLVDPAEYFSASLSLLRPGGLLITSVPSEDSFLGSLENNVLNAPPHHLTCWTDEALQRLPASLGFVDCEIYHLPVEKQHYKWFISSLLSKGFRSPRADSTFLSRFLLKVKLKLAMSFLRLLGSNFSVPSEFNIPGHTVVSIHKKPGFVSQ